MAASRELLSSSSSLTLCSSCSQRELEARLVKLTGKELVATARGLGSLYSEVSIKCCRVCSAVPVWNPTLTSAVAAKHASLAGAGCSTEPEATLVFNVVVGRVYVNTISTQQHVLELLNDKVSVLCVLFLEVHLCLQLTLRAVCCVLCAVHPVRRRCSRRLSKRTSARTSEPTRRPRGVACAAERGFEERRYRGGRSADCSLTMSAVAWCMSDAASRDVDDHHSVQFGRPVAGLSFHSVVLFELEMLVRQVSAVEPLRKTYGAVIDA